VTKKPLTLLAAAAMSLGGLALTGTTAVASPDDSIYPSATPNGGGAVSGSGGSVYQVFTHVEPGTTVHTVITSCTGINHESTKPVESSGPYAGNVFFELPNGAGPTLSLRFTTSAPGKTSYADPVPVVRNNPAAKPCSGSGGSGTKPVTSAHIKKWSTKKSGHSKARAGKTAKVTKTYLKPAGKGMKVTYRWTAGSKTIDKDRSVKVSRKYVGKKLKLKVTVSKTGYKSRSKTLNFGTIKK
jgi:hypothetical protein